MKKAIVVGGGAGGAIVAKELQDKFDVTILADGTLLTKSLGNPPILSIMAMAKRVSKIILGSI